MKWERGILARLHAAERLADYLPEGEKSADTSVEDVCVKDDLRHPCPCPTVAFVLVMQLHATSPQTLWSKKDGSAENAT